jgi:hypothetical protein
LGGRGRRISEFEASLVYRVSSRTARATEKPCLEKPKKKKKKKKNYCCVIVVVVVVVIWRQSCGSPGWLQCSQGWF